jgi:hypothetical protein
VVSILKQIELLFTRKRQTPRRSPLRAATSSTRRVRAGTRRTSPVNDPFLFELWKNLRVEYFPDRPELDGYTVQWSSRKQKRVLASCNIRQRRVVVARELFEPSACRWIAPVLYHELCHAVIGEGVHLSGGKRQWHGRQFRELEARHPDIPAMNAWIRSGGWAMAVRSERARRAWQTRRAS